MAGFRKVAKDTALLTASSVVMRCIGLAYQVWLAGRIGAAGLGLWQLVMSVNVFTATLAISGIRFTTTRLVAEEMGRGNSGGVPSVVGHCLRYACFFGGASFLIQYLLAGQIGFLWIKDARTVESLRVLAFTLPLISLSCVLNGYFIATGYAWKSAAVQLAEQLTGIVCVIVLLDRVKAGDTAACCSAIARGTVAADVFSLLFVALLYFLDRRKTPGDHDSVENSTEGLTGRMLRVALPLALAAYARTGLTTLENLLVPSKLRTAGFSADRALAGYGTITGMVFPIISFPSCLLNAVAELTVPELTAAQVEGRQGRIDRAVSRLMRYALGYALVCGLFLFICAEPLGYLIYRTEGVGGYIRIFALLVPFMYVDIVTDGCLKGLGQMLWSMCFNIAESVCGVVLVFFLLPRWALNGYIFVLFFCELFNFTLSVTRLRQVSCFRIIPKLKGFFPKKSRIVLAEGGKVGYNQNQPKKETFIQYEDRRT